MSARPALGTVAVGDRLIVQHRDGGGLTSVDVVVTAVFRVRIVVEPVAGQHLAHYLTEFDLRTQEGYGKNSYGWFRTPEQHDWYARRAAASAFLQELGIHPFELRGELRQADMIVDLAAAVGRVLGRKGEEVRYRKMINLAVRLGGEEPKHVVAETRDFVVISITSASGADLGERAIPRKVFERDFERITT